MMGIPGRKNLRAFIKFSRCLIVAGSTLLKHKVIKFQHRNDQTAYSKATMALSKKAMENLRSILGIQIEFNGAVENKRPTAYVANHFSYLDGPIIGSLVNAVFVSKKEGRDTPVFGAIMDAMGTIFIERNKEYLPLAHAELTQKINVGRNVMFFPEATSTDGSFVLPFRAGLLAILFKNKAAPQNKTPLPSGAVNDAAPIVEDTNQQMPIDSMVVQPLAMKLSHVNDIDLNDAANGDTQEIRDLVTWHKGHSEGMIKHAWTMMKNIDSMRVEVTALPALDPKDFADRKDLINTAFAQVEPLVTQGVTPNLPLRKEYEDNPIGGPVPKVSLPI